MIGVLLTMKLPHLLWAKEFGLKEKRCSEGNRQSYRRRSRKGI